MGELQAAQSGLGMELEGGVGKWGRIRVRIEARVLKNTGKYICRVRLKG